MKPMFTKDDVRAALKQQAARYKKAVFSRLQFIGETFIADARNNGSYTDRTGNLRSSKGYIILEDGVQVTENFEGESEGQQKGRAVAAQVAQNAPTGFVLICVAGMEYAAAVEAKGFDVITMSSIKAEAALKRAMERIKKRA